MPRRPATLTQADIARVLRAAKQAGAAEVVVKVGDNWNYSHSLLFALATPWTETGIRTCPYFPHLDPGRC